jgi:N-formylmaleamate deformylase
VEVAYRGFHEDDIHSDLSQLKLPILLVVAGKGGVIQPEDIAEFKALLPSIEVERVENAAHLIPWDDFEGFFQAQSKFFNGKLAA